MAHEMVLTVNGDVAELTTPISLADAGLLETKHLQQWVITHPAALGEGATPRLP